MPAPDAEINILFSSAEIASRIGELAEEIGAESGPDLLIVAILKGSFVFAADLVRALHQTGLKPEIDFITLSSYGAGTESSGRVAVLRDIAAEPAGRRLLLIDDILESGRTLAFAREELTRRGAEVRTCVLLDKRGKRKAEIEADYVGFVCPDRFVVGYGLDYAHYFRELPYIGTVEHR
ncbi:MAG: hypoxanthine phosphoribosyltransferase [Alphaproteobacteria bacterium]|nr:hypoxanthine phosphoribosyltransferase [Alphaproteobacteria bacterium]